MKLLFLSGSSRLLSFNKMLARQACGIAQAAGVDATFIDLKDYPMPIYNGDEEEANGMPDSAMALKKLFVESTGFFIASPEYNSGLTPLLNNSLNWISRPQADDAGPLAAFHGKFAAVSAASPGALGGLRGLVGLRMMLGNIGVTIAHTQLAIPQAHTAFDREGQLMDIKQVELLTGVVHQLIKLSSAGK